MSLKLIEDEILSFLSTKEPSVICISGHWGVGKTYARNRNLRDAQANNRIALASYSYVSLFGVNSLDEFKYSIFENSIKSSEVGFKAPSNVFQAMAPKAKQLSKKSIGVIQEIPFFRNYIGGLGPIWFSLVKDTIICIDDIERRGKNLSIREVLGLASNLKELKGCKVALILNDEALEEDKDEFRKYFEKVVDTSLRFEPTAQECANIALPADKKTNKLLAERCIALGISNIRLIMRIERSVHQIEKILNGFDEQVLERAVQSLALLGWSVYDPSMAPWLEFLQKQRGVDLFGTDKTKVVPVKEAAWNALLDAYGFAAMDEFDIILLDGIRNGFFDPSLVGMCASELNEKIKTSRLKSSFWNAWMLYHDSFADNEKQVLDTIYESARNNIRQITPMDLNGTVILFKDFGRQEQAAEIIKLYVEAQEGDRRLFDLVNYPFGTEIKDADVIQAFRDKFAAFKTERDPADILISMVNMNGWNEEDIATLSMLPIDRYYDILKKCEGQNLHKIIGACLQFDNIGNATEPMKEISRRAKEALRRIGAESAMNARRVKRYGVEVSEAH